MLATLRRIIDAVDRAPALDAALAVVVRDVKQAIGADVCSVYLTDTARREHVLMATDGLPPASVGRIRIPLHRGLIGRAAERADIVNLDDAHTHACYLAITDSGEEPFHGFLGVPIIQHRRVLGVLVLRRRAAQRFADDEVTFVMTLAMQLAAAIALARGSGELMRLQQPGLPNHFLEGIAAAPGVGIGTAYVVYAPADLDAVPDKPAPDPDAEIKRFRAAVAGVAADIGRLAERMGGTLRDEDQALFDAWRLMLESESLVADTIARIRAGNWAQGALRATVAELLAEFDRVDDPYLRERGSDVRDLGRQVLVRLQHGATQQAASYPSQTLLVGDEISAMQIAAVPRESLAGIISRRGSASSHLAILARGMGVPAAVGVLELPVSRLEGRAMIVDGYRGRVYVEPSATVAAEYRRLAVEERAFSAELEALRGQPSETTDGFALPLYLNTGLVLEQRPLGIDESAGVGLYRTELPFMVRDRFPGEEAQQRHYRQVLTTFAPRPVTIRTLDVGGDKPLPYFPVHESNPFLGWRGIRITRDHPEIFMTQVRAMLRAAVGLDNLQLLLPMITTVDELDDALALIQRACEELQEEGHAVRLPPVGAMIEVPAAVYQADVLARRVSFLSVGTNDLTQYLLAVDRNNARVAALYDEFHPAVLRALMQVAEAARGHGREVTVCGELAGDPRATPLLLGLGVHSLSMGAGSLLRVKGVVRSISRTRARELLARALLCERGACVRALLMDALEEIGLGGLVRPGR